MAMSRVFSNQKDLYDIDEADSDCGAITDRLVGTGNIAHYD